MRKVHEGWFVTGFVTGFATGLRLVCDWVCDWICPNCLPPRLPKLILSGRSQRHAPLYEKGPPQAISQAVAREAPTATQRCTRGGLSRPFPRGRRAGKPQPRRKCIGEVTFRSHFPGGDLGISGLRLPKSFNVGVSVETRSERASARLGKHV